jgi:hypothetical protein
MAVGNLNDYLWKDSEKSLEHGSVFQAVIHELLSVGSFGYTGP